MAPFADSRRCVERLVERAPSPRYPRARDTRLPHCEHESRLPDGDLLGGAHHDLKGSAVPELRSS